MMHDDRQEYVRPRRARLEATAEAGPISNVKTFSEGPGGNMTVVWDHNQEVADAAAGVWTVDIHRDVAENPGSTTGLQVSNRNPKLEKDGTDTTPLKGGWRDTDIGVTSSGTKYLIKYRVVVKKNGIQDSEHTALTSVQYESLEI